MPRLPGIPSALNDALSERFDAEGVAMPVSPEVQAVVHDMHTTVSEGLSGIRNILENTLDRIEPEVGEETGADLGNDVLDAVAESEVYEAEAVVEADDADDPYDDTQDI